MLNFVGGLTEDQIENKVSRMIDRVDAAFMDYTLDQKEYDLQIKEINDWSEKEYRFKAKVP